MITVKHKLVLNAIQGYRKAGIPYTFHHTQSRSSVECPYGSFTTKSSKIPGGELHFIKAVKKYVSGAGIEAAIDFTKYELKDRPTYILYGSSIKPGDSFSNIINVDITAAYWQTAKHIGIIDEAIFQIGMDEKRISKATRLAAIGTLAKKTNTYHFDGKTASLISETREDTEHLWNVICYKVGVILIEAAMMIGDDFLFFWVDGIYVKTEKAAKKVEKFIASSGYTSKREVMSKMEVSDNRISITANKPRKRMVDGLKQETNIRPYYYSPNSPNTL